MRRKSMKQNSGDFQQNRHNDHDEEGTEGMGRDKKSNDEYKCGKAECGKLYHSYTAFYNHCKKSHEGIFPANSIYNGNTFEGPSKNRGRPRIKKTDAKDSIQIESLKTQNELIQFLGTLPKKKKSQELIVYVANPIQQLNQAILALTDYKRDNFLSGCKKFLSQLVELNSIVSQNDLPDFYDPIQIHKYSDKMDSYNFLSIYNFLTDQSRFEVHHNTTKGKSLMRKIIIIWLTRILSIPLLAQVIYTIAQIIKDVDKIDQKQYMIGKASKFRALVEKYFECTLNEQYNSKISENREDNEG